MKSPARNDILFENLTLSNVAVALFWSFKGHQIYYFALGRVFRKTPRLAWLLSKRFHKANIWVSEFPGLSFNVHQAALEAAEHLYGQIIRQNPGLIKSWSTNFRSQKVHLYVKKKVATESWNLIKIYLILVSKVDSGHDPVRLVALDNALNRIVIPWLVGRHPESRVRVTGLARAPWRWFNASLDMVLSTSSVFVSLLGSMGRRGFRIRGEAQRFKVCKEILWGIDSGEPKRNDDFMVDDQSIRPKDILFYHRKGTAPRLASPEMLPLSLSNARDKGYECVNFERTHISMGTLWTVIVPRYIVFSVVTCIRSVAKQISHPSAGYLNNSVMTFLKRTLGWEVFLASYSPGLHLSQDEPQASHIADTVALNLHGSQNAGFQWADMTQWQAVTLAYVGYNIYFAWGALSEKYWNGNWAVDRVVHTGYLWAHNFQESLDHRDEQRRALIGDGPGTKSVVALLDEKPGPDLYTSEKMLYDFYNLGVELLNRRPDTTVIAKPKSASCLQESPEILELIGPWVESGRFLILDKLTVTVPHLMAISDVVVSMVMGSPYLEAACCRRTGFNYAPIGNYSSRIYSEGLGKIIFDNANDLIDAIEWSLDHPEYDPWDGLEELRDDVDPYRDTNGIERLRQFIGETSKPHASGVYPTIARSKVPEEAA